LHEEYYGNHLAERLRAPVAGIIFFYQRALYAEYYGNHLVKRLRTC